MVSVAILAKRPILLQKGPSFSGEFAFDTHKGTGEEECGRIIVQRRDGKMNGYGHETRERERERERENDEQSDTTSTSII